MSYPIQINPNIGTKDPLSEFQSIFYDDDGV
jgi:hypothetical protein